MKNQPASRSIFIAFLVIVAAYAPCDRVRAAQSGAASNAADSTAHWVVDPAQPGDNLPAGGRSLFDFLVTTEKHGKKVLEVPFPFTRLIKKLGAGLTSDNSGTPPLKHALIPLGRSLQRTAAAPAYFAYPRIIVMTDSAQRSDGRPAQMLLKDRLYIGYQEKAEILEIISYNEAAGRFEFQVVKDYRRGATPQIYYANRSVCTACHQNGAPIFSRQLWDETNANPGVAARLRARHSEFYGLPVNRGVDIPYAIDNATDRANLYSAYQLLWREGCGAADDAQGARCRAALFAAALQYRLSGYQEFDERSRRYLDDAVNVLANNVRTRWPRGLLIPNPDLPNRNPVVSNAVMGRMVSATADIAADFDPLNPRPALETWPAADPGALTRRLVVGLAEFFADADMQAIDIQLARLAAHAKSQPLIYESRCTISRSSRSAKAYRITFNCPAAPALQRSAALDGQFEVAGGKMSGTLNTLAMSASGEQSWTLRDLDIAGGEIVENGGQAAALLHLARSKARVRRGDGNTAATLKLNWSAGSAATALISVIADFTPVQAAIAAMPLSSTAAEKDALSNAPFRRAALMPALFARLGLKPLSWCCIDAKGMPPPAMESVAVSDAGSGDIPALRTFYRYCSTCHETADRSPPNFLLGDARTVSANLAHCAPRLYVRLSMWQVPQATRRKTPMPPIYALSRLHATPDAWRTSAELAMLKDYVAGELQKQRAKLPSVDELMSNGYEQLPSCLPA